MMQTDSNHLKLATEQRSAGSPRTRRPGLHTSSAASPSPNGSWDGRVRGLVASRLGVDAEELLPEVSLADDLAADELDLLEIAVDIEDQLGIVVPEAVLERVRTYGDLLDALARLAGRENGPVAAFSTPPAFVRAQVCSGATADISVVRLALLTPDVAAAIAADALHAPRGARLDIAVPEDLSDQEMALVTERFAAVRKRGIEVTVRRATPPATPR